MGFYLSAALTLLFLLGMWVGTALCIVAKAQSVPSMTEQGEFHGYTAPSPYNPNYAVESEAPGGNRAPCN